MRAWILFPGPRPREPITFFVWASREINVGRYVRGRLGPGSAGGLLGTEGKLPGGPGHRPAGRRAGQAETPAVLGASRPPRLPCSNTGWTGPSRRVECGHTGRGAVGAQGSGAQAGPDGMSVLCHQTSGRLPF